MASIYDIETYEPKAGLGHLIGRVRAELLAALDAELAHDRVLQPLEVTGAQLIVIVNLAGRDSAVSASALCRGISYDAGAMTRMLDRLEAKGLIRRARCAEDRRLILLELTEAGREAYPRIREISMRVMNHFLRGFTPAEARQLESLMTRMLKNA